MPVTEHLLVELVHDVFNIEFHLPDLAFGQLVGCLLTHKEVDPLLDNCGALEGRREVRIAVNGELDVSHIWSKLINGAKVERECIDGRYNFLGDVEHALALNQLDAEFLPDSYHSLRPCTLISPP